MGEERNLSRFIGGNRAEVRVGRGKGDPKSEPVLRRNC
jgi:hypothetical protein